MKIKKFRFAVIAALCVLLTAASVYAAEEHIEKRSVTDERGNAEITLRAGKQALGDVFMYIFEPGYDLSNCYQEDQVVGCVKMELFSNCGPSLSYGIHFSESAPKGAYTVIFGGAVFEEEAERTAHLIYADASELSAALRMLSKAEGPERLSAVLEDGNNLYWALDFAAEAYVKYQQEILELMYNGLRESGCTSTADLNRLFYGSCALAQILDCEEEALMGRVLDGAEEMGIAPESVFADYPAESAAVLYPLLQKTTVKSASQFQEILTYAAALTSVNISGRDSILSVIEKYYDVFELTRPQTVGAYELSKLLAAGVPYADAEAVRIAWQSAVKDLADKGPEPDRGRPSGGGGGAGTQGPAFSQVTPTPVNQETVAALSPLKKEAFSDLQDAAWAAEYIEILQTKKVLQGDGNGCFRPNDAVTREEFVKILLTAFGIEAIAVPTAYTDASSKDWYYPYLAAATERGIVKGQDDGSFGVGKSMTRQDAAVLIARICEMEGYNLLESREAASFADAAADYAAEAVGLLQRADILNGFEDGTFRPEESITRAQTAKLLCCTLRNLELI